MSAREHAVRTLFSLPQKVGRISLSQLEEDLINALTKFGMMNLDDVQFLENIEYDFVMTEHDLPVVRYEFKIRDTSSDLSDILNSFDVLTQKVPENLTVSENELEACQRIIVMVIFSTAYHFVLPTKQDMKPVESNNQNAARFFRRLEKVVLLDNASDLFPYSHDLMRAFIMFGSETPDNLNCFEHIEYGVVVQGNRQIAGLKIKSKPVLVSQLLEWVKGMPLPDEVRTYHPNLSQDDWQVTIDTAHLIMRSLEHEIVGQFEVSPDFENIILDRLSVDKIHEALDLHTAWVDSKGDSGQRFEILRTDLSNSNLSDKMLIEALCAFSKLNGCSLKRTHLGRAILVGSSLSNTDLQGANLTTASLDHANLESSNLRETRGYKTIFDNTNMQNADLSNTSLREARLRGADLRGASLESANLEYADLTGAKLAETNLRGATNIDSINAGWIDIGTGGKPEKLVGSDVHNWFLCEIQK